MPSTKTETAIRFPENDDQTRRLKNVTQDRKAISKKQREAGSVQARREQFSSSSSASWGPEESMSTSMDQEGEPQPDPEAFSGSPKKGKRTGVVENEGMDLYDAANDDFD